jgi:predicted nucleic acid-binding protein
LLFEILPRKEIEEEFELHTVNTGTIKKAIEIKIKYKFSFWDSLIVASALENRCNILYTEDLQHGQVIETTLKIVNPFKLSLEELVY